MWESSCYFHSIRHLLLIKKISHLYIISILANDAVEFQLLKYKAEKSSKKKKIRPYDLKISQPWIKVFKHVHYAQTDQFFNGYVFFGLARLILTFHPSSLEQCSSLIIQSIQDYSALCLAYSQLSMLMQLNVI